MKNYEAETDEVLVEWTLAGDTGAMDFLLNKYKNLVRSRARTLFLVGADKEDLIQEGMIGLYKAVRDYNEEYTSFAAFAKICVIRQILTAVKNSTRNKHKPLNSYVSLDGNSNEETDVEALIGDSDGKNSLNPENILIDRENLSGITYRINQILSGMELEVLALYLDGFSYQEIAEKIGKDCKSVDNAIQRIRKKIGKILDE